MLPVDEWRCAAGAACNHETPDDDGAYIGLVSLPNEDTRWRHCWHDPAEPDKRYCEDCTIDIEEREHDGTG